MTKDITEPMVLVSTTNEVLCKRHPKTPGYFHTGYIVKTNSGHAYLHLESKELLTADIMRAIAEKIERIAK